MKSVLFTIAFALLAVFAFGQCSSSGAAGPPFVTAVYCTNIGLSSVSGDDGGYNADTNAYSVPDNLDRIHIYFIGEGSYQKWSVWIDWNGDGSFGAGEKVVSNATNAGFYETIYVPNYASGIVAMRVVVSYFDVAPCGSYAYGETEDYLLEIE